MLAQQFEKISPGRHAAPWKLGGIALAWGPQGITRVELGRTAAAAAAALAEKVSGLEERAKAPAPVAAALRRLRGLAAGKTDLLEDVPVDLSGVSPFAAEVYRALRRVPPGKTVTYGELAARAGSPGASRAVGRIMGANPVPVILPCHRCIGADGTLTGFSSPGGVELKARLLHFEGWVRNQEHRRGIEHLRRRDKVLRPVIDAYGPYLAVPDRRGPAYDTLVRAIVHQQLSVKAGRTIAARVAALTPGPRFPSPDELMGLKTEALRAAGLSGQKASYLQDLAARVLDGRLDLEGLGRLDDEAVIEALTTVKGIGVWSAHMHMIFHLGRLDVLPVGDLGVRMGAGRLYGLGEHATPAQLERIAAPWRPYRSLGAWYLWRALDSGGI